MFAIQPSISTNCLLVELSLHWGFNYKQVDELGLLVARLVAEVSSQLGLLSAEIGKTVQVS